MTRHPHGFVLVNALVLVAAMASVAVFLLSRAETTNTRLSHGQSTVQTRLYLDAFESLALTVLTADIGALDHSGEAWARPRLTVPLDRGQVSGEIADLQSRFNVNWLSNIEDPEARDAFARLLSELGLPDSRAASIIDFVTPGAKSGSAFARRVPPISPRGGPVVMFEQLAHVPGLSARELERLRPYVSALPGDATLNINTASAPVLRSLLPGASSGAIDGLIQRRTRQPISSADDLSKALAGMMSAEAFEALDETRFSIGSNWFHADIAAELEGRILFRQVVLERQEPPKGVRIAYRLQGRP